MIRKLDINEIDKVFSDIPEVSDGETKHSIPDVYGKVIRLGIILKDSLNVEEERLPEEIIQWRGIFTILALKDFMKLDVEIESMPLKNLSNSTSAFRKAIDLKPKNGVIDSEDWNWDTYHIIKLRKNQMEEYVDIALFSPSTLVYPVADINEVMPFIEEVTWFEGKKFINPVTKLNQEQKKIVYFWLQEMIKSLHLISEKMTERYKMDPIAIVIEHLKNYQQQLEGGKYKCLSLDTITKMKTDAYKVYKFINQTVKVKVYIGNKEFDYFDVFADKIQCIKAIEEKKNVFVDCINLDKHKIMGEEQFNLKRAYAILPLGRAVVNQVTQEQLEQLTNNIEMRWVEEKKVAVTIHFSKIDTRNIDITKELVCAGENIWDENDMQIALWPKIKSEDWKKYYLYLYKGACNVEICHNKEQKRVRTGGYVYEYSEYPSKVEFEENSGNNKNYLGVLLPQVETTLQGGNRAAKVVIDFGTSATVCYVKIDGKQEEEEIFFEEETSMLLMKKNDSYGPTQIAQNFVPLEIEKKKMYSVYKAFENNNVNKVKPILEGIIYYARNMEIIPDNTEEERFITNFKWMTNINRAWYQAFLCQLCMQITLYLKRQNVGNISWKYALPLSLSQEEMDAVGKAWEEIKDVLTNIDSKIIHKVEEVTTESQAVSNYFYCHKQVDIACQLDEEAGYIIADIGGGSIDFSLWQKNAGNSKIWETSVPVASRKLFSQIVFEESRNIAELFAPNDANETNKKKQLLEIAKFRENDRKEIGITFLEKFIEDNSDILQKRMSDKKHDDGYEWIESFRKRISLGAAMVLYCAGQLVGEKICSKDFKVCNTKTFYVVLAGNGSKLFDWVFDVCWENENEEQKIKFVNVFLEGVRSRTAEGELNVKIVKSLYPKEEVARGLLFTINESINSEKFQKGNFKEKEIIKWKNKFLKVYTNNFGENDYGKGAEWNNIASRLAKTTNDSSNIMLQDILKQLY